MLFVYKLEIKEFFRKKESLPLTAPASREFWRFLNSDFEARVSIPPIERDGVHDG